MAADRNLDVVLALAAAAWKAGVPADEIIRVVQTIELAPRGSGEKNTGVPAELRAFGGDKGERGYDPALDPEVQVERAAARARMPSTLREILEADKPAKPE